MPVSEPLNKGDLVITKHNINGYVFYCSSRISSGVEELNMEESQSPISLHTRIFVESEYEHELAIMNKCMKDPERATVVELDEERLDLIDKCINNSNGSAVVIVEK